MNGQKRVFDYSRGYVPKTVYQVPQQQQVPTYSNIVNPPVIKQQPYTVTVNPNRDIIYQTTQQQQVPTYTPVINQPQQPVQSVKTNVPQQDPNPVNVVAPQPEQEQKNAKASILQQDPSMKGFVLTGCKNIEEIYEKNKYKIKIVPE
jgi:hypothetical protein